MVKLQNVTDHDSSNEDVIALGLHGSCYHTNKPARDGNFQAWSADQCQCTTKGYLNVKEATHDYIGLERHCQIA